MLAEIRAAAEARPESRALLVVPDPLKLDTEAFLMQATDRRSLLLAEVLGFRRLAERVLGEVGGLAARYVDASGRTMAVHRVLKAHAAELAAFGPMADRPGFVPQVETVLSELRRYGVRPDDLVRSPAESGDDRAAASFRGKAHDLAVVLRGYEETLDRLGLLDPGGDLDRLSGILRSAAADREWPYDRIAWLRDASVWIDGFGERRDFTPQETRVVEALAGLCREVTVTLCADIVPGDEAAALDGPDALAIGRRTAYRLNRRLAPLLVPGGVVALDSPGRGLHPELLHLRRSLERGFSEPYDGPADAVVAFEASDAYEETAWAAAEIRRLVEAGNLRFRDVAVAACSFEAYAPLLESAFEASGVAAFLDREVRLTGSALPRFVLSFLNIASASWSLESVMACLRTGLAGVEPEEADRLENFFLARGIRGKNRIFDDRRYAPDFEAESAVLTGDADEEGEGPGTGSGSGTGTGTVRAATEADAVRAIRDRALRPLADALESVGGRKTCSERCAALETYLRDRGMPDRVYRLADALRAKGLADGSMRLVKSWNALCSVLRQMEDVAGDEPIPLDDFAALLSSGIDAARAGTIPASPDAVIAGPPDRVIARRPAVLFVLGASADALPQKGVSEGLLTAADRESLAAESGIDLPSGVADKPFEDAFREYSLLSLPTERLYLGYAATDRKGANLDPSPTVVRVAELLPGRRRVRVGPLAEAGPEDPRRRVAPAGPAHGNVSAGEDADPDLRTVRLPAGLVAAAYGGAPSMSVSQLETYAACPFSHFCKHLLALRPRDEWKPELSSAGTLAHGVVELAMDALRGRIEASLREGGDPDDVLRDYLASDVGAEVDRLLRTAARRERLGMFFDEGFRMSAGRKVRDTAEASLRAAARQLLGSPFRPVLAEWGFGTETGNALVVRLADGTPVRFQGRVDRVDADRSGDDERFAIVDYKTGDKRIDYEALWSGLAFQLPAYLAAYRAEDPARIPVEAGYFYLHVPRLSGSCAADAPAPETVEEKLQKEYRLRGLGLDGPHLEAAVRHVRGRMAEACGGLFGGTFDVRPVSTDRNATPCSYCDFRGICRKGGLAGTALAASLPAAAPGGARTRKERFAAALDAESGRPEATA